MPHYQRNVRLILFFLLPVMGFVLGWVLSAKTVEQSAQDYETIDPEETNVSEGLVEEIQEDKKTFKKVKPKDVDLDIFWEAWQEMESNFLYRDNFDTKEQIYGATKGMIDALGDSHSVFLSPKETQDFTESIEGEFDGIGAEVGIRNDNIVIITPLKGSPAELAGLMPKDIIYEINGESARNMSLTEAVSKIKGPKGEKVTLTVVREGEPKPLDIVIVRDHIEVDSVDWSMNGDIAVVEIAQFGVGIDKEFSEAVTEIVLESPVGMVVDLRNNGGGVLDAAKNVISEFLEEKVITTIKGLKFLDSGDLISKKGGRLLDIPLVVIVNHGSASASEIFAGAIQDHDRGTVIGDKTFGKGSVQNLLLLSDGSSLKVTIAEWLTPKGGSIHDAGIEPDEYVEITADQIENDEDPILDRALELLRESNQ